MLIQDSRDSSVVRLLRTRTGFSRAVSDLRRREWHWEEPHLAGYESYHACPDRRAAGRGYAAACHAVWGAHVYRSVDGGETWAVIAGFLPRVLSVHAALATE